MPASPRPGRGRAQRHPFLEMIGRMMIGVAPVFVLTPLFTWRYRRKNIRWMIPNEVASEEIPE
ncbi:MAG: hypothetical protein ACRDFX_13725 [Chloroflexota bacterium]